MGFHEKWVSWMNICLQFVQFPIVINGDPIGQISSRRGLRQGDQLSSYLFILCTGELLDLLKKTKEAKRDIHGVKMCREAPSFSHILFADILFFFCRVYDK